MGKRVYSSSGVSQAAMTLTEIAEALGISHVMVRRIEASAMNKIRRAGLLEDYRGHVRETENRRTKYTDTIYNGWDHRKKRK